MAILNSPYALRVLFSIAILGAFMPILAQEASPRDADHQSLPVPSHTASIMSDEALLKAERLYQRKCGACHSLDHNRVGPRHRFVFGAQAGSVANFRYSHALQNVDVIWNEDTLDEWLQNPPKFVRGTSMGFSLRSAEERAQIIEYLKSVREASSED